MAYKAEKPKTVPDSEQLRATVLGWGVDLDPRDRPAVPKEQLDLGATGAHWDFPERQVATYDRERSTEHAFLTPVFGTVCPPKGLSGVIRRYAYRFSEGQTAHWTLLMLADRIDVMESRVAALLHGRPDNFFGEMGLRAELRRHGLRSRTGQHRNDWKHILFEPLLFVGSTALGVMAVTALVRRAFSPGRRRRQRRFVPRWARALLG